MPSWYDISVERTAAASTYVTNAQADNYLKVEFDVSAENTLIDNLLKAAEAWVEDFTNLCINEKDVTLRVWDLTTDSLPEINLPYKGTLSDLVVTTEYQGVQTVLASTAYFMKAGNVLCLKSLQSLADSFLIEYTVAPLNLPDTLQAAILRVCGDMYDYRSDMVGANIGQVSMHSKVLLTQYKDVRQWI